MNLSWTGMVSATEKIIADVYEMKCITEGDVTSIYLLLMNKFSIVCVID